MRRAPFVLAALGLAALLFAGACASAKDPSRGFRSLEAVVVEREHDQPGERGASFRGTGNYYLAFETREGDATSRYRFQVTEQQYRRYPEGSRVVIYLAGTELRDIRPAP